MTTILLPDNRAIVNTILNDAMGTLNQWYINGEKIGTEHHSKEFRFPLFGHVLLRVLN